jgi:low affinity Fe/Cu permease
LFDRFAINLVELAPIGTPFQQQHFAVAFGTKRATYPGNWFKCALAPAFWKDSFDMKAIKKRKPPKKQPIGAARQRARNGDSQKNRSNNELLSAGNADRNSRRSDADSKTAGKDEQDRSLRDLFHTFSNNCARLLGSAGAFVIAGLVIVVWGITGPIFKFSDTWQLVINTGTTIVTFLMVFLIQNTQNRDARAQHLKLDELLRAITAARTGLVDLESLSEEELDRLEIEFKSVQKRACENCKELDTPESGSDTENAADMPAHAKE